MINIVEANVTLGKKLKKMREDKGVTQKDLAYICEVTPNAICMYEKGERLPSPNIMKKYSLFFNKTVDEIFFE